MSNNIYKIEGSVLKSNNSPIQGLMVQVWDFDSNRMIQGRDDFLGVAITDGQGKFEVSFTDNQFGDAFFFDKFPDFYFKVFSDQKLIYSTENQPMRNVKTRVTQAKIQLPDDVVITSVNHNPSAALAVAANAGIMTISLKNNTLKFVSGNKKLPDSQVFFSIMGYDSAKDLCHLDKNGNLIKCALSDNTATGHLTHNGQDYSNYFMSLDKVSKVSVPKIDSGRLFFSLESPLFIKINTDANGKIAFAGPDPSNSSDPNNEIFFDWLEFTVDGNGFHGNTTQVDMFGIPSVIELTNQSNQTQKAGIITPRSSLISMYKTSMNTTKFADLMQNINGVDYRVLSPFKGSFAAGKANDDYFDSYIDQMWTHYQTNTMTLKMAEGTFSGKVVNNEFQLKDVNGGGATYTIKKPTSPNVFECVGALKDAGGLSGKDNDNQLAIQAQVGAMLNRHIMQNAAQKCVAANYYHANPSNLYAEFWHKHSIAGKAYGFPYDDACDHSTLLKDKNPKDLSLTINWD